MWLCAARACQRSPDYGCVGGPTGKWSVVQGWQQDVLQLMETEAGLQQVPSHLEVSQQVGSQEGWQLVALQQIA